MSFLFCVWANQNHWQEWLNMHPECEFSLWLLSWPEPLTRLAEHAFRVWVCSPVFELIRTTDKIGWTCIQSVSLLSSVLADWDRWWDWLNMHPVCESFSSIWADQNNWCKWLNMHPGYELLFSEFPLKSEPLRRMVKHIYSEWVWSLVFEQIRITDKNGWTHTSREWAHSPVF